MSTIRPENMQALSSPPGVFQKVYITAKRIYATQLLEERANWPSIYFTARWSVTRDNPFEQSKPAHLWVRDNVDDILRSDHVVCFAQKEDVRLANSIWECGVAWAHGKNIYLVGENEAFKEWQFAGRSWHFATLAGALTHITNRAKYEHSAEDRVMAALQNSTDRIAHLVQDALKKE